MRSLLLLNFIFVLKSCHGEVPADKIDFSDCVREDDGRCCILTKVDRPALNGRESLECRHKDVEVCHYTFVTTFHAHREEQCGENFVKKCYITFRTNVGTETIQHCYTPMIKICDGTGPEICTEVYESSCTTKYTEKNKKHTGNTTCEKIPVKLCGAGCRFEEGEKSCHEKEVRSPEELPEETCDLLPRKSCQFVTKLSPKLVPKHVCTTEPTSVCQLRLEKVPGNRTLLSKWCLLDSDSESTGISSSPPENRLQKLKIGNRAEIPDDSGFKGRDRFKLSSKSQAEVSLPRSPKSFMDGKRQPTNFLQTSEVFDPIGIRIHKLKSNISPFSSERKMKKSEAHMEKTLTINDRILDDTKNLDIVKNGMNREVKKNVMEITTEHKELSGDKEAPFKSKKNLQFGNRGEEQQGKRARIVQISKSSLENKNLKKNFMKKEVEPKFTEEIEEEYEESAVAEPELPDDIASKITDQSIGIQIPRKELTIDSKNAEEDQPLLINVKSIKDLNQLDPVEQFQSDSAEIREPRFDDDLKLLPPVVDQRIMSKQMKNRIKTIASEVNMEKAMSRLKFNKSRFSSGGRRRGPNKQKPSPWSRNNRFGSQTRSNRREMNRIRAEKHNRNGKQVKMKGQRISGSGRMSKANERRKEETKLVKEDNHQKDIKERRREQLIQSRRNGYLPTSSPTRVKSKSSRHGMRKGGQAPPKIPVRHETLSRKPKLLQHPLQLPVGASRGPHPAGDDDLPFYSLRQFSDEPPSYVRPPPFDLAALTGLSN